jgi:hypothetical protein
VGPYRIIFLPPALYQDLGLGVEKLPVEQLIPQLPIEALVVTILPGTARFNVSVLTPTPLNHSRTALAVNSGPLSDRL